MFDFEAIVVEIEMKVRKLIGENRRLRVEAEEANERCRQLQEQVDKQNIVINNLNLWKYYLFKIKKKWKIIKE